MTDSHGKDPVLEILVQDFGANFGAALGMLEQYRADPKAVDESWRRYFSGISAPRPPQAAVAVPLGSGDEVVPLRGGATRVAENMEASLQLPTASSGRTIPVRTLEENRRILNRYRERNGGSKIGFTHIAAYAMLRALERYPRLNDAYAVIDSQACRIQHGAINLGIAVDVVRKDGTRTLTVPSIKHADRLDFGRFVEAFDELVARTRKGMNTPEDFLGTTVTLTNPGTVGTTFSVARLMQGQGLILVTGALDYPPEYRSMSPRTLSHLGIGRVMTLMSTYDHRIIQGVESGLFLARIEELLRGEDLFYERVFCELEVPHPPVHWEPDTDLPLAQSGANHEALEKQAKVLDLIRNYRVRGHLVADLDPLDIPRPTLPELNPASYGLTLWDLDREFFTNGLSGKDRATLREILDVLRETYCGTVGVEYMFIQEPDRRTWLQERMESSRNRPELSRDDRLRILSKLIEAETFERFLHAKYVGHKRFSLEGCEALIPVLDHLLNKAAEGGVQEMVIGMSHRGRLNVLANIIGKPLARIFSEFEGNLDPNSVQGSGDVKYHVGAAGVHRTPSDAEIQVSVSPNPSHLEAVDPVVEGMVRAKQDARGDADRSRCIPVLLHGDAAFAGQGVVAETLNLAALDGFTTGGTIHVIVDNQIGFTTMPRDARSSTYCTDVARMVQAPIFHVNGEDPEALVHMVTMALDYRQQFHRDVVLDLVGYRKWGHNEGDEPSYTQPLMYARIQDHPTAATTYGQALQRLGVADPETVKKLRAAKNAQLESALNADAIASATAMELNPRPANERPLRECIRTALQSLGSVPDGFRLHPKLVPFLKKRADLLEGKGDIDWSTAEALALGTLVQEGISSRLTGQDVGRGTFSQRHAILCDTRTGKEHIPLDSIAPRPARFEIYDSSLSEFAVLGFEYGYSVARPDSLVLWEAQFGDFANGGQIIIDQFIAASESKWNQSSGLVLLLPHGQEGQGPEHSSARMERFLQLAAEENLRLCYPSTPASYFNLLRRQARDSRRKPLVVFTPKSLLRHPLCVSSLADLEADRFLPVLDDEIPHRASIRKVILMTGKIYYDVLKARERLEDAGVALIRMEQLAPFPGEELAEILQSYPSDAEWVWLQEEPENQGAWQFVRAKLLDGAVPGCSGKTLRYLGRPARSAPASGSLRTHNQEQESLVKKALEIPVLADL